MTDFRPVTDQQLIERLAAGVGLLLDGSWHFRTDALMQRWWVAVPVEKGRHIERANAQRIVAAIRQVSVVCYALATESLGKEPSAYEVAVSEAGLLSFSHECAGLNFILVPFDCSFALLFTSEDYNVYAGSKSFVEAVVGVSIAAAREAFHRYADDSWWEGRMLDVYNRYASFG